MLDLGTGTGLGAVLCQLLLIDAVFVATGPLSEIIGVGGIGE